MNNMQVIIPSLLYQVSKKENINIAMILISFVQPDAEVDKCVPILSDGADWRYSDFFC
jgi:hypothetical protein